MKKPIFFICVAMFISWQVTAQRLISPTSGASHLKTLHRNTKIEADELPFDESLKPFYHGVASGDPLAHQVIIWTRVTPDDQTTATDIAVKWMIATDTKMTQIVQEGEFMTHADRDYTVKIDVTGLNEGTTYYYQFEALGKKSSIGRTKTTPTNTNHVKFAVVSCQNYEGGYFNAYAGIAAQNDLDAVIHLGDYIYEYGKGVYGADSIERTHIPDAEILNLADYRTRYSLYRLDPNLRRTHQQHPFIAIWDDHETANDSYKDGAENHNDGEGNWETRKNIAKKVYAEWMPIRGEANSIYRTIQYGNLLDLVMIDTRIEGREQQINDVTNPALYAPDRTLLGQTQKNWFLEQLQNSQAKWKIIGNQIIFSEFHVGWASLGAPSLGTPEQLESTFLDIWDGYPAERDIIIDYLTDNQINNVVWLTGDFHCAFAFDVAKRPSAFSSETPNYNPETGAGAVAVEFATPSISSANFNENLDAFTALALQFQINKPLSAAGTPFDGVIPNPHMKYVDLIRHGYFILDITDQKAQADWFYAADILTEKPDIVRGESWFTNQNENRLQKSETISAPKTQQDAPAPSDNPVTSLENQPKNFAWLGFYPNPVKNQCFLNYVLNQSQNVQLKVVDVTGRVVLQALNQLQKPDNYTVTLNISDLKKGIYFVHLQTDQGEIIRKMVKE